MAAQEIAGLMDDLHKQLESATNSRSDMCISTLAKIGNTELVERFLTEPVMLKSSSFSQSESAKTNQVGMLQNYLYTCCFWGFRNIVKRLLDLAAMYELGVNLSYPNKNTLWTPLHAATFQEHGPTVMLLLENGANPNSCDANGWTPTHFASVSDKIWSHFGARGIQRVPMKRLLEIGVISTLPDSPSHVGYQKFSSDSRPTSHTLYMSSNNSQSSDTDYYDHSPRTLAARSGDVLAREAPPQSASRPAAGQRRY